MNAGAGNRGGGPEAEKDRGRRKSIGHAERAVDELRGEAHGGEQDDIFPHLLAPGRHERISVQSSSPAAQAWRLR